MFDGTVHGREWEDEDDGLGLAVSRDAVAVGEGQMSCVRLTTQTGKRRVWASCEP